MSPGGRAGRPDIPAALLVVFLLCLALQKQCSAAAATPTPTAAPPPAAILVVGSLNLDVIVHVDRLPASGETITARRPAADTAVGGKGANQAVAAARLAAGTGRPVRFVGRFGNDAHASALEAALAAEGVDVTGCGRADLPSGQGIVLLEPDGGATSVVLGGSNTAWAQETPAALAHLMRGTGAVLLQREVPEHVNEAVAAAAVAAKVPVLLDVGGEDRPISTALLKLLDYICPNESELARLTGLPTGTEEEVLAAAASLTARGARNVLVTLGPRCVLLLAADGSLLRQEALPLPGGGAVVDATAAGDAFRAAFAVALVEGRPLQACLQLASAAGAVAVSRMGAVPSLPTRAEAEAVAAGGAGGTAASGACSAAAAGKTSQAAPAASEPSLPPTDCPYQFASRLNSMQARRDLVGRGDGGDDVLGWIACQSRIRGLSLVDLNHPQHTAKLKPRQLHAALAAAGLAAGAIAMRFTPDFSLGAFSNPDAAQRARAVALAAEGCRWAAELGARDLIVWPQYDGYDYNFQMDYPAAWRRTVEAYQQLADACPPGVRVSIEHKPTDESTRWALVPSTGAALLLARDVNRPNFGLTLDYGHLLMAGENPAQSAALVGAAGKLFGVQLNDAHVKLGAEDGLAFGSVNPTAALEFVRQLQRVRFDGHIYFDTLPRKEDPVREAEYNIRRFRALWARATRLAAAGIDSYAVRHDALGVLELLEAEEAQRLPAPATAGAPA